SMEEKMARLMVENHFFERHPEHQMLLPAACFFSRGILDQGLFERVREETYLEGRFHVSGKMFSFEEYQRDLGKLKIVIRAQIEAHAQTPWVKAAIKKHLKTEPGLREQTTEETLLKSFWKRFDGTWRSL